MTPVVSTRAGQELLTRLRTRGSGDNAPFEVAIQRIETEVRADIARRVAALRGGTSRDERYDLGWDDALIEALSAIEAPDDSDSGEGERTWTGHCEVHGDNCPNRPPKPPPPPKDREWA